MSSSNTYCPFCLDEMEENCILHETGSIVHASCPGWIRTWLINYNKKILSMAPSCPICRQEVAVVYQKPSFVFFVLCEKCLELEPKFFVNLNTLTCYKCEKSENCLPTPSNSRNEKRWTEFLFINLVVNNLIYVMKLTIINLRLMVFYFVCNFVKCFPNFVSHFQKLVWPSRSVSYQPLLTFFIVSPIHKVSITLKCFALCSS